MTVTVYYTDGEDRRAELAETLARIRRRVSLLRPGDKRRAAEERIGKVADRIEELDEAEADAKMRAKFHKDMADLVKTCREAVAGPASVRYRHPDADGAGAVVWAYETGRLGDVDDLMVSAGLQAGREESDGPTEVVRYEFDEGDLDAGACNGIRLAVEAAARLLWEEHGGKKTENGGSGGAHADKCAFSRGPRGWNPYAATRIAAKIAAGTFVPPREGQGRAVGGAGGLSVESGRWLAPEAELTLWVRETMKWIYREGATPRDDIEAQIGARVANDPERDAKLFDATVAAVSGASIAVFEGSELSLSRTEKEDHNGST